MDGPGTALDELIRLGDELRDDYGHWMGERDDQLSLILNDLDLPNSLDAQLPSRSTGPFIHSSTSSSPSSSSSSSPPVSYSSPSQGTPSSVPESLYYPQDDGVFPVEEDYLSLSLDPPLSLSSAGVFYDDEEDNSFIMRQSYPSDDSGNHSPTSSEDGPRDVETGGWIGFTKEKRGGRIQQQQRKHINTVEYTEKEGYVMNERSGGRNGTTNGGRMIQEGRTVYRYNGERTSSEESGGGGVRRHEEPRRSATRIIHVHSVDERKEGKTRGSKTSHTTFTPITLTTVSPPSSQQKLTLDSSKGVLYVVPANTVTGTRISTFANPHVACSNGGFTQKLILKGERVSPPPATSITSSNVMQRTLFVGQTAPSIQYLSCSRPSTTRTALVTPIKVETQEMNRMDDEYIRKQEDRKQKNRAAAQQSRVRRRNELEELRERVTSLTEKNIQLEQENEVLKKKLREYQQTWSPPRKKVAVAGLCLSVLLFMVAFQPIDRSLSPFAVPVYPPSDTSISHSSPRLSREAPPPSDHAPNSRALMAVEDYDTKDSQKGLDEYENEVASIRNGTLCKGGEGQYPNRSETMRLNDALDSWVARHDRLDWMSGRSMFLGRSLIPVKKEERQRSGMKKLNMTQLFSPRSVNGSQEVEKEKPMKKKKSPRGEAKLQAARERAMRDRAWKHLDMVSHGIREGEGGPRPEWVNPSPNGMGMEKRREEYEKLAAAVQQRTDTLYVVAMRDYLLLPAIHRNSTSRPRVSLILPALNNGTMTNQVLMMRIDFDVVSTGLVNLADQFLPLFNNFSNFS